MDRLAFIRAALATGWEHVRHPAENVSLLLALAALFGLPTTAGLLRDSSLVGLVIGITVGTLALISEGAFHLWRFSMADDEQARQLRVGCESWRTEVCHFLDVRAASRPLIAERGRNARTDLTRKVAGLPPAPEPPDVPEERKAAELHDRETVSQYLAEFSIKGEALFDALIARHSLKDLDRNRELIRHPRNVGQINEAVQTIQLGEWGDLRWRPA